MKAIVGVAIVVVFSAGAAAQSTIISAGGTMGAEGR